MLTTLFFNNKILVEKIRLSTKPLTNLRFVDKRVDYNPKQEVVWD